jgi:hypothetical protein
MPNYCDADVTIYGSRADLEALLAKASEGTHEVGTDWDTETRKYNKVEQVPNTFSFDNFLPTPPEKLEGDGWFDWRIENWGTKWDLVQNETHISPILTNNDPNLSHEAFIGMGFQTAWSPALEIFARITEQFPNVLVRYKYVEEGMAFFGLAEIYGGEIDNDQRQITDEDYKIAGAVLDAEGQIDWELTDEYDLYDALDYWKEGDNE